MAFPFLSTILWLPALGALLLFVVPAANLELIRRVSLAIAGVVALLALSLIGQVNSTAELQLQERLPLLNQWGSSYALGIDGLSLWLVVLTALMTVAAIAGAGGMITERVRGFFALLLALETALFGVFLSSDLLVFYIFYEFTLIPMSLLIALWGGSGAAQAARKFFLYTFAGSVLMLLAIIGLRSVSGSFDYLAISEQVRSGQLALDPQLGRALFGGFFLAFAIKAPIWPFHTWLPDAYRTAPTAAVVVMAAVMGKLGTYGLLRFCLGLFPEAALWAAPAVAILAIIGILYGALIAAVQQDMRTLLGYSSLSHIGFIVLGIFSLNTLGTSGALFQMVSHGLTTGALFLAAAYIAERVRSHDLEAAGGLWRNTPALAGLTLVAVLGSVGLPGLSGFIGEFTIMQGAFNAPEIGYGMLGFAVIGVILAAVYLLRFFRSAFMGELSQLNSEAPDLQPREALPLALVVALVIALGLFPNLLFTSMQASLADLLIGIAPFIAGS